MAVKLGNGNWAVKEDKLLAYNDNSGLFFNKEFDFSRGTSATYVAKDGLIKTAGIQPNIVTNGTFETDSDWTKTNATISGGVATITVVGGAYSLISQSITYQSGKIYKLTAQVQGTSGKACTFFDNGSNTGGLGISNGVINFDGSLQNVNITFTANSNSNQLLVIRNGSGDYTFTVDSVSVQEIQTDTPRIDFTNDTKGHLLLEPSRTNLITYSEDFSDSSWTINGATITSNSIISPNGTLNATKLVENSSNSQHKIQETSNPITAGNVVYSQFVKKGERNKVLLELGGGGGGSAKFDLDLGVVISQSSVNATITKFNDNWYRCSVSFTSTSSSVYLGTYILDDTETLSYQGDGTSGVYIWGAQLEQGSYATSYIPTTGATSTRNADVCNNSGSAQDFNSEEGVLYAEIAGLAEDIGASKNFAISDGTNNNAVKFVFKIAGSQIGLILRSNATTTVSMTYNMPVSNFFKMAFKYKANDCALWVNGTEVLTDTNATMPLALSTLQFDRGDGANDFIGKVRNVQVFTEALTDEQLEKLTS